MPALAWSDSFVLDLAAMDDTHREFIDLLATVVNAADPDVLSAWQALVSHTEDHFERENHWMRSTGFAKSNCHSTQHDVILQIMREGDKRGQAGDLGVIRQMAYELGIWFPGHAENMDAALATYLRSVGFDPATGIIHKPQAVPEELIHGCGGGTCVSTESDTEHQQDALTL